MPPRRRIAAGCWRHSRSDLGTSVLIKAERRDRLPALAFLRSLPISDQDADEATIIALDRRDQLTGYDAAYLAVAQANAVSIATRDTDLRSAAQAEHVVCLL